MPRLKAHKPRPKRALDLQLFIAGSGARSLRSIDTLKRACEKHAAGKYHLSIVDIYLHPEEAVKAQIVAVPTLVRRHPEPVCMYVGDLSSSNEFARRFSWLSVEM